MHKSYPAGAPAPRRMRDVDVLCGAAVLFVIAQHLPTALSGAPVSDQGPALTYVSFWSGIDLLLAVVGFLAARELAPRLAAANGFGGKLQAVGGFWLRCIWRGAPSAWLWLAVGVIGAAAFNRSGAFGPPGAAQPGVLASALGVENLRLAFFARGADQGLTFPYWALSLAAQFCLLLPLVVALARPRLVVLLAAAVVVQLIRTRTPGDAWSLLRTDALLLGALVALWARDPIWRLFEPSGLKDSRLGRIVAPAVFLFLLAATASQQLHLVPFNMGIVAVLAAVLVWLASYDAGYVLPEGFGVKGLLAAVGARALSIYVAHIPAFLAAREIWFRLDPASLSSQPPHLLRFLLTALVLTAVLAELNHRLIEASARRIEGALARRFGPGRPQLAATPDLVHPEPRRAAQ